MPLLLGSAPNQVSVNSDLGTAAFIDAKQLPVSGPLRWTRLPKQMLLQLHPEVRIIKSSTKTLVHLQALLT
jgi:hypothetical protein